MKTSVARIVTMLLIAGGGYGAVPGREVARGKTWYLEGEFKKAAAVFESVIRANPENAEAWYWAGMSNQALGDIAFPFAGRQNARARKYLKTASILAPERPEYRMAYFDFLLDSSGNSRSALKEAAGLLATVPESDPDYAVMVR